MIVSELITILQDMLHHGDLPVHHPNEVEVLSVSFVPSEPRPDGLQPDLPDRVRVS